MTKRSRGIATSIALLALSSCMQDSPQQAAPPPPDPSGWPTSHMCREPRPQMCMDIYQPVCGFTRGGAQKTFPNSCYACAQADIVHFIPGACGEPPK